jgi:hypothetical protein
MSGKKRLVFVAFAIVFSWWSIGALHSHLNPNRGWKGDEEKEEARWIASSNSWFDRAACRWLGICGAMHLHADPYGRKKFSKAEKQQNILDLPGGNALKALSLSNESSTNAFLGNHSQTGLILKDIPQFVLEFAPLVYLHSGESYWPSDPSEHLKNTVPHLNYTKIENMIPSMQNLDQLNELGRGRSVYLQSKDDVEKGPEWLHAGHNIPNPADIGDEFEEGWADWDGRVDGPKADDDRDNWFKVGLGSLKGLGGVRSDAEQPDSLIPVTGVEGDDLVKPLEASPTRLRRQQHQTRRQSFQITGGKSSAPATLIVVDKGGGIVDAFWFYFYSFNLGISVFNIRFGNHIGDWEHSMVRFQNGTPRAIFFSEHSGGQAYSYAAVEKIGRRPVIYSAKGTHAMYATAGKHPYILPFGLLQDDTDKGPLWDPTQNMQMYNYDYMADTPTRDHLEPSSQTPDAPVGWFYFNGHWGDKFYKLDDKRQYRIAGQYNYVNGPIGPRFKNLGRQTVCQSRGACKILDAIGQGTSWVG